MTDYPPFTVSGTGVLVGPSDGAGRLRVEDSNGVRWIEPLSPDVPTSEGVDK